MTLSKIAQIVKITHLRRGPLRGCESMGRSGLKARLLGFSSSGSQHNHLPLKVYFSESSRLPHLAPLMSYCALPPSSVLVPRALGLSHAYLSHTLCQPLVGPVYLAADRQLQGGTSIALAVLKPFVHHRSLKRQRTPTGATSQEWTFTSDGKHTTWKPLVCAQTQAYTGSLYSITRDRTVTSS